jgi:hypothetical protein
MAKSGAQLLWYCSQLISETQGVLPCFIQEVKGQDNKVWSGAGQTAVAAVFRHGREPVYYLGSEASCPATSIPASRRVMPRDLM